MRRRALSAAAALLLAVGLTTGTRGPAQAQVIIGGCTVYTNIAAGISFGNYDPLLANPIAVVWPINFTCPFGTAGYTIAFDGGQAGNARNRHMSDALGERLNYNLYQDAAHTIVWGDGSNGTSAYVGTPSTAKSYTIDVYAYLPGGQKNVSAYQSFSDTITATVTF